MAIRETLKEAGYTFIDKTDNGYVLKNEQTGQYELWFANKNHASYGLRFRGTDLEFAHGLNTYDEKLIGDV